MTQQEVLSLVQNWHNHCQAVRTAREALRLSVGITPEAPLITALSYMEEGYAKAVGELITQASDFEDVEDTLLWWLYENDLGAKNMNAKAPSWKKELPLSTTAHLAAFILDVPISTFLPTKP